MIFEQESLSFQILDVLFFDQDYTKKYNFKRYFDALTFRYEADTIIEYKDKQIHFVDNSIGFFPSDCDYTRITKKDKMIVVHFKAYNYHSNDIEGFFPEDYKKYQSLFAEILDCWNKKETAYKHKAASLLNNIFSELYKDNKKTYDYNSKINSSVKYMEYNYLNKDFSLRKAAEKSYISDTYFRKLFKQEFGISPKQYIINRRIKQAASLIIAGYYSLQEISELCGYNDYKHFSVEFKKIIGVSPSMYNYNYYEN